MKATSERSPSATISPYMPSPSLNFIFCCHGVPPVRPRRCRFRPPCSLDFSQGLPFFFSSASRFPDACSHFSSTDADDFFLLHRVLSQAQHLFSSGSPGFFFSLITIGLPGPNSSSGPVETDRHRSCLGLQFYILRPPSPSPLFSNKARPLSEPAVATRLSQALAAPRPPKS